MQGHKLARAIKKRLKYRGIGYSEFATALGTSESTVKRALSKGALRLSFLEQVCSILGCTFLELVKEANADEEAESTLSIEQEAALAHDLALFGVFYFLLRRWTHVRIRMRFGMDVRTFQQHLAQLEKLGLLERHARAQVRLLVNPRVRWRPRGPIEKLFFEDVRTNFLGGPFEGKETILEFVACELTSSSLAALKRQASSLARAARERAEIDGAMEKEETHGAGLLVALRPWVHPAFRALDS